MLKMFPRPKRTGGGRDHAIVFIVGGWVPVLLGECETVEECCDWKGAAGC